MADARFHERRGPFSLGELAEATRLFQIPEGADPARKVVDVAPLETAGPDDLTFLENRKYLEQLAGSSAGFCVIEPELIDRVPTGTVALATPHPYLAYALVAQALYPAPATRPGTHPAAYVDPSAKVGEGVEIAANAVVEAGAEIGDGTVVAANATVGRGVVVGRECRIGSNASLEFCILGDRVDVQAGARIGAPGFGFAPHPERHRTVPQLGRVLVGDDCHIGANTCIACGSGHDTVLGRNVWIDNLVQIAHNCEIGDGSILVGQVGMAGSTKVGRFVQMGGQAGLAGHIRIGDQARIGAKAGVMNDVEEGATLIGQPAIPVKEFWRQVAALRRLGSRKGAGK
ncbi:MAG: UDP-3-O-(3-hydroxymyristoyl)glucosamine N-acyltransferase [Minwuia sp.]|uniref:UDP-3-O-(3-hydroxymyristoyl)glucosamine N-acyltransferase n=1 Tax=Minwuia sp. TaxID=2493630 RepID=UPI003A882343